MIDCQINHQIQQLLTLYMYSFSGSAAAAWLVKHLIVGGLGVLCDYRQVADTHSVCIVCAGLSLHALQPSWLKRLHSVVMMSLDHARFTVQQSPTECLYSP